MVTIHKERVMWICVIFPASNMHFGTTTLQQYDVEFVHTCKQQLCMLIDQ